MKTPLPRYMICGPNGCKAFDTAADHVVLPGFSSYEFAAGYCESEELRDWEIRPLNSEQTTQRLKSEHSQPLKLVAIDPLHARELSLPSVTLESACQATGRPEASVKAEYRLMRDHWDRPWSFGKITAAEASSSLRRPWYVACRYPHGMKIAGGQPLWYWLDWFDGCQILTELFSERPDSSEKEFFLFRSRETAEGFYGATVVRMLGCVRDCRILSYSSSEFEVTMWEKGKEVCNRTSASISERLWWADAGMPVAGMEPAHLP